MDLDKFREILVATQSAAQNKDAELALQQVIMSDPDFACGAFVACMSVDDSDLQRVSAVLFRRYSTHHEEDLAFWKHCSPRTQNEARQGLLEAVTSSSYRSVRNILIDTIVHIAKIYSSAMQSRLADEPQNMALREMHFWPELLEKLWTWAQAEDSDSRCCGLRLISIMPAVFGALLKRYIHPVREMFEMYLQEDNDNVQTECAKAYCSLLLLGELVESNSLLPLLPIILQLLERFVETQHFEPAQELLQEIVAVAEYTSRLLRPIFQQYVESMNKICACSDEECRKLAMEALTVVAEGRPHMVRRAGDMFVQPVLHTIFKFMLEIDDDAGWSQKDEPESPEEFESIYVTGEQALDRIAVALKGDIVYPVAQAFLEQMFGEQEFWQPLHAAILAISVLAEGCLDQIRPNLTSIIEIVIPFADHEHPRVRYAVCQCLGQLATDFSPKNHTETAKGFQYNFAPQVLPTLQKLITNNLEHPRVQVHAAAALVNFVEGASSSTMEPYLHGLLETLASMLQSPALIAKEQAATALSAIASVAKHQFKDFYGYFVPPLLSIVSDLTTNPSATHRQLRGKAIEAISYIGQAVGAEMFHEDAEQLMAMLVEGQQHSTDDDDASSFTLSAFGRICQVLGDSFGKYMSYVFPFVHEAIYAPIDFVDIDDANEVNPEEFEVLQIAQNQVGIKTAVLGEIRGGLEMLTVFARVLKGSFAPYMSNDLVEKVTNMIAFAYDETVRSVAAICVPCLLLAMTYTPEIDQSYLAGFCSMFMKLYSEQMSREDDSQALVLQFRGLQEIIMIGKERNVEAILNAEFIQGMSQIVTEHLAEYHERHALRYQRDQNDEDYDPEAPVVHQTYEDDNEDLILNEISAFIHELFDAFMEDYVPIFKGYAEHCHDLLAAGRPAYDLQWGLCIFDDLIEAGKQHAVEFFPLYAEKMLESVLHPTPEVRQAAAYGIGAMGETECPEYVEFCQTALNKLAEAIEDPTARDIGNVDPTENCISAFIKIIKNPKNGVDPTNPEVFDRVLSWMPVTSDPEEAEVTYDFFLEHITQPIFQNMERFATLFQAIATVVFDAELLSQSIRDKILIACSSHEAFDACFSQTPTEFQEQWQNAVADCQSRLAAEGQKQ